MIFNGQGMEKKLLTWLFKLSWDKRNEFKAALIIYKAFPRTTRNFFRKCKYEINKRK